MIKCARFTTSNKDRNFVSYFCITGVGRQIILFHTCYEQQEKLFCNALFGLIELFDYCGNFTDPHPSLEKYLTKKHKVRGVHYCTGLGRVELLNANKCLLHIDNIRCENRPFGFYLIRIYFSYSC